MNTHLPGAWRLALPVLLFVCCIATGGSAWAWPPVMLDAGEGSSMVVKRPPFPVPEDLRGAINFWRDVFTKHASDQVVIHDRDNMELVWRVIELPQNAQGLVDAKEASKFVKEQVEDLRQRLNALELDPTPQDDEDRVLLALAGNNALRVRGAADRVRTQRGVADHFRTGLARSRQWVEDMRTILREEGVPEEIACLPFVESMFNPFARSHVGAAGLWQLMPATAKGLGLKVHRDDDERLDVRKATRAAARLLRQNYRSLGSWPLAITAYNHGPNGVRRAVDQVGSTDLMQLIDGYQKSTWGFASKNFYAEFLAALSIINELDNQIASFVSPEAASVRD